MNIIRRGNRLLLAINKTRYVLWQDLFKGQYAWEIQVLFLVIQWWHLPKTELRRFNRRLALGRLSFWPDGAWKRP